MKPKSSVPPSGKETVDAVADHWGKLMAIAMNKLKINEVVITAADIEAIGKDGQMENSLVVQELDDGLHIRLMPTAEAIKLAQQTKGGFGRS